MSNQNSAFTVEFDAIPDQTTDIDAVTALSQGPGNTFDDYAAIVRFKGTGAGGDGTGFIDVRNGDLYAYDTPIPFSAGTPYHFQLDIDVPNHTYSVWVTPAGSTPQLIATDYAFRSSQANVTNLNNWGLWSSSSEIGSHQVCNFTLNPVQVVGAWTADGNWNPKTTFAPGDSIQWVIDVQNPAGGDALIELTFDVHGPNGEQVAYWNDTVTTAAGNWSWGLPGTVPSGMGGTHTFSGYGLFQGVLLQAVTTYFVTGLTSTRFEPVPSVLQTSPPTPHPGPIK